MLENEAQNHHLLVVCWRVALRSGSSVPVCFTPFETMGSKLIRRETARPRGKAARNHDCLLSVP